MEDGPGRLGPYIGHAENVTAPEFFFHIRNDLQELGIGIDQHLKGRIFKSKKKGQVILGRHLGAGFPFIK